MTTGAAFAFDLRLYQISAKRHQIAGRLGKNTGTRDGDKELIIWQLCWQKQMYDWSSQMKMPGFAECANI